MGRLSPLWSYGQFPGGRLCPALLFVETSRAIPERLATQGRTANEQSVDVCGTKYRIHHPPVLPALRSVIVRRFQPDPLRLYRKRGRCKSSLDHCSLFILEGFPTAAYNIRSLAKNTPGSRKVASNPGDTLIRLCTCPLNPGNTLLPSPAGISNANR